MILFFLKAFFHEILTVCVLAAPMTLYYIFASEVLKSILVKMLYFVLLIAVLVIIAYFLDNPHYMRQNLSEKEQLLCFYADWSLVFILVFLNRILILPLTQRIKVSAVVGRTFDYYVCCILVSSILRGVYWATAATIKSFEIAVPLPYPDERDLQEDSNPPPRSTPSHPGVDTEIEDQDEDEVVVMYLDEEMKDQYEEMDKQNEEKDKRVEEKSDKIRSRRPTPHPPDIPVAEDEDDDQDDEEGSHD